MKISVDTLLNSRIAKAHEEQSGDSYTDPIENDPRYSEFLQLADIEAEEKTADKVRIFGYCHLFWGTKQEILLEKYGIVWFSPDEMNPHICFD